MKIKHILCRHNKPKTGWLVIQTENALWPTAFSKAFNNYRFKTFCFISHRKNYRPMKRNNQNF